MEYPLPDSSIEQFGYFFDDKKVTITFYLAVYLITPRDDGLVANQLVPGSLIKAPMDFFLFMKFMDAVTSERNKGVSFKQVV